MNSIKINAAALICALSLISASVPMGAGAAEWINLSSWAYEEVSGFVSDGLLPDSLSGVSDYTRPIKRWELGELIYSVLYHCGQFSEDVYQGREFSDCEAYPNITKLYRYGIAEGDGSGNFRPEENITREDAAVLIGRAMDHCGAYYSTADIDGENDENAGLSGISDSKQISGYARSDVLSLMKFGIMNGTGGGFEPKSGLSVEQAVIAVYRVYKWLPRLILPDNEGISGENEQTLQEYPNGAVEAFYGNSYLLKKDGKQLMTFETDVYSKILSCDYGGETLAFAVNFNDKTDVFRAETGEFMYTIPYIVYKLRPEEGHIYVYSSRFMPAYSGIYGFDGSEIIKPEYSETELEAIAANGYDIPQEQYRAADGWVYYSNWNDNGHLYKVDSNGENGKLLVDGLDCKNTYYFNGMLYFNAKEDGCLYCIDEDGNALQKISETPAQQIWVQKVGFDDLAEEKEVNLIEYSASRTLLYGTERFTGKNGRILYGEDASFEMEYVDESTGERTSVPLSAYILYEFSFGSGERKKVADFPVNRVIWSSSGDDRVLFTNYEEAKKTGASPIYMYDGSELKCITGSLKAVTYGFMQEEGSGYGGDRLIGSKVGFVTPEDMDGDTYHIADLDTGEITVEKLREPADDEYSGGEDKMGYDELSGDGYEIYRSGMNLYVENGSETKSLGEGAALFRDGDILYYANYADLLGIDLYGYALMAYNMRTGGQSIVSDRYVYCLGIRSDVMSFQEKTGHIKKIDGGETLTVYPNKGLKRYGEVDRIEHRMRQIWQPRYVYKIDKDGNCTQLTDCQSEFWLYVPNGADKASFCQYG